MWTFDEGLADWSNDANNWGHKWVAVDKRLCLRAEAVRPPPVKDLSPWASSRRVKPVAAPTDVQARLWSGLIPSDVKMQCLTLAYMLTLGQAKAQANAKSALLSLLQRQEG